MWNYFEIAGCPSHAVCTAREIPRLDLSAITRDLAADAWGLVPLGSTGELLWCTLPFELARLVAPPTDYAVCLVPRGVTGGADQVWSALMSVPSSGVHICDPQESIDQAPLPELAPRRGRSVPPAVRTAFQKLSPPSIASPADAQALKAGILQLWDELHLSHEQSQDIEGEGRHVAGDYWHGIMHRREPDYGNAKYWFRRVGRHPVFEKLAPMAVEVLSQADAPEWTRRLTASEWDPCAFVDLCQHVGRDQESPWGRAARRIQLIEMLLLLNSTWHDAVGG